jgi:hypothetical protein
MDSPRLAHWRELSRLFAALAGSVIACTAALAQQASAPAARPIRLEVRFSKPLAVLQFLQQLSTKSAGGQFAVPGNQFKSLMGNSEFNTPRYAGLIATFDSLRLDYTYDFPQYPAGQKIEGSTGYILRRNLLVSRNLEEFRNLSVGIIPARDLSRLVELLTEFAPVYDKVVYDTVRVAFEKQLRVIDSLGTARGISDAFSRVARFYHTPWDPDVPFIFAFYPLPNARSFSQATAFANVSLSPLPTGFTDYPVMLSLMLHEASHILLDEAALEFKQQLHAWFEASPSRYSAYASGLTQESWASAVFGYFGAALQGQPSSGSWYGIRYVDQMAKAVYPQMKEYLDTGHPMDRSFVDAYISTYETSFPGWITEWDNVLIGRIVMTDTPSDLDLLNSKFRYRWETKSVGDFSEESFRQLKEAPLTRLIIVSKDHRARLAQIKNHFPELKDWNADPSRDFAYSKLLSDKRQLIVINLVTSSLAQQLQAKLELR